MRSYIQTSHIPNWPWGIFTPRRLNTPDEGGRPWGRRGAPRREQGTSITPACPYGHPALRDKVRVHPRQETDKPIPGHHQPLTILGSVAFGCTVHRRKDTGRMVRAESKPGEKTENTARCRATPFLPMAKARGLLERE